MTPDRRTVLLSLAAMALVRPARALDLPREVDVAIIGAGAAGLAAAHELRRRGKTFVLLEARNRTGGRVHTDRSLGGMFDAGAQYVHWADRNPWRTVAVELGIPITEDRSWGGNSLVFVAGRRLTQEERARRSGGFRRVSGMVQAAAAQGDMSFTDAIAADPEILPAAQGLTRFTLGEDPEKASVADYEQLWAGEDNILPGGYGSLVAAYGTGLPVALETPAQTIRWDAAGVQIDTPRGTLRARAVIITVSVGVLQAEGIRFLPGLPAVNRDALEGLRMGALTKIALAYDPGRVAASDLPDLFDVTPEGSMTSIEFRHRGQDGLALALLGGDHARAICELGERGAIDYAIGRIGSMLGTEVKAAFGQGRLAGWWSDPYARGSYSIARPGRLAARAALAEPIGGRVFIAGEATAGGGAMTAGGAYLEGVRAAGLAAEAAGRA